MWIQLLSLVLTVTADLTTPDGARQSAGTLVPCVYTAPELTPHSDCRPHNTWWCQAISKHTGPLCVYGPWTYSSQWLQTSHHLMVPGNQQAHWSPVRIRPLKLLLTVTADLTTPDGARQSAGTLVPCAYTAPELTPHSDCRPHNTWWCQAISRHTDNYKALYFSTMFPISLTHQMTSFKMPNEI